MKVHNYWLRKRKVDIVKSWHTRCSNINNKRLTFYWKFNEHKVKQVLTLCKASLNFILFKLTFESASANARIWLGIQYPPLTWIGLLVHQHCVKYSNSSWLTTQKNSTHFLPSCMKWSFSFSCSKWLAVGSTTSRSTYTDLHTETWRVIVQLVPLTSGVGLMPLLFSLCYFACKNLLTSLRCALHREWFQLDATGKRPDSSRERERDISGGNAPPPPLCALVKLWTDSGSRFQKVMVSLLLHHHHWIGTWESSLLLRLAVYLLSMLL